MEFAGSERQPSNPRALGDPESHYARQLETLNAIARIATLDLELRPMLQRITDALASAFDWEFVALVTIDDERTTFTCEAVTSRIPTDVVVGYSRPVGSGVVGQVAADEKPLLLDDVRQFPDYVETAPGILSEVCVPVKHAGRLVAVLNLESTRAGAFGGQLPLLLTVAEQIAGAIASARMFEELRRRARLMEMMSEISRTALDATDLDGLIDRVVRYIHERFPVAFVAVVLHDAAREEWVQKAYAGVFDVEHDTRFPVTTGVIGRCIRRGLTQVVRDVRADPDYLPIGSDIVAELVVPIRFRGEVLGALDIESPSDAMLTPANVLAFEALADQVAGAIHLATIKELLDHRTRDLEAANAHLARSIETLHRLSSTDSLTGTANRRSFDETLDLEWRRAARTGSPIALLMVDIDQFKAFNDEYGHQAGDECLRRVADALREKIHRAGDMVARYGGEEFAVLLNGTDAESAPQFAEQLREAVAALQIPHAMSGVAPVVTISVGVGTTIPERESTEGPAALISAADAALYAAKRTGRNRVVVA
jgi:diguanylate cyclase (GGDEF)-like protein